MLHQFKDTTLKRRRRRNPARCYQTNTGCSWRLFRRESNAVLTQFVASTLSRMSGLRTIVGSVGILVVSGVGIGMWSMIAPGEERRKELLKVILAEQAPFTLSV